MIFLTSAFGLLIASFVLWRKLKEDYTADQIFYFTLLLVAGGWIGYLAADKAIPAFSFWGFVVGIFFSFWYAIAKLNMKFFEVIDSVVYSLLWFFLVFYLGQVNFVRIIQSLLFFLSVLLALFSYLYFARTYRRFSWYPSGKIGFVGLSSLAVFFFVRLIIDFYFWLVVKLPLAVVDLALSGVFLAVSVTVIYLRSGLSFFARKG